MELYIAWVILLVLTLIASILIFKKIGFKTGEAFNIGSEAGAADNYGVEAAVSHLSRLFEHAQHEILIVSDDLGPDCWGNSTVTSKLSKAVMEGTASGRIIVGPDFDLSHVNELEPAIKSGLLKVRKLKYRPKGHFVVVDSRSVRLEEPHDPKSKKLKAKTFWTAHTIARKMQKHFEELWEQEGEDVRYGNGDR